MIKNTAGQFLTVYVWDSTTGLPKTGDAANLTAYRAIDGGSVTVLTDTSATEKDSTNAKGYYQFDLSQAETNGDVILYSCKSSTANMVCKCTPDVVQTVPPNFTLASIDSNGRLDIIKIAGTTQTARDIGASVLLSNGTGTGQVKLASGYVAMTWADIGSPTTTVNLSGTTIGTATTVTGGATASALATLQTTCNTIAADTDDIQTRLPAALVGGRMDASVGAMAANTLTASALATDAVTEIATAILATALTESYGTDGSAFTLTQALYQIWSFLSEASISGTTKTSKKLDGSTTAMTFTLNSSSQPTSITRAS